MSKSRQSKIEEIRQQSVDSLREERMKALHAKDKNTPLISEEVKQTLPPPPPPGAAGASSGGGGAIDVLNCILPGICPDSGEKKHQVKKGDITNVDFLDLLSQKPSTAQLNNPGTAEYVEEKNTDWRARNDQFSKFNFEYMQFTSTGRPGAGDEYCIPRAVDKLAPAASNTVGVGQIWGFNYAPYSNGPSIKKWGFAQDFSFISQVEAAGDLPDATKLPMGTVCYVDTDGSYYFSSNDKADPGWFENGEGLFFPNSNTGTLVEVNQIWDLWQTRRDIKMKGFGEFEISNGPAVWAAYYLPEYMLFNAGFSYGNEELS